MVFGVVSRILSLGKVLGNGDHIQNVPSIAQCCGLGHRAS